MYKNTVQKFSSGCFLLVRKKEDSVVFLGTTFLVHDEGYLLTAAHLLEHDMENLMVVRPQDPEGFNPLSFDSVSAIDVKVCSVDAVHNVALLTFKKKYHIESPDYLIGSASSAMIGSWLISLGFPFGHQDLHNLVAQGNMLGSKVMTTNGTKVLLFDSTVHEGMAGGPLVSIDDGRAVGIIIGRFSPEEGGDFVKDDEHPDYETGYSYAVSIEYGKFLLEKEGLEVS